MVWDQAWTDWFEQHEVHILCGMAFLLAVYILYLRISWASLYVANDRMFGEIMHAPGKRMESTEMWAFFRHSGYWWACRMFEVPPEANDPKGKAIPFQLRVVPEDETPDGPFKSLDEALDFVDVQNKVAERLNALKKATELPIPENLTK